VVPDELEPSETGPLLPAVPWLVLCTVVAWFGVATGVLWLCLLSLLGIALIAFNNRPDAAEPTDDDDDGHDGSDGPPSPPRSSSGGPSPHVRPARRNTRVRDIGHRPSTDHPRPVRQPDRTPARASYAY